jgi:hypothetical protein
MDTKDAIGAANRWTDNIFIIRSYCCNNFGMEQDKFNEHFGISADFDYVE